MTSKTYLCEKCGITITVTRPPIYLTFNDGTKKTYDYDPDPPEHCPDGHTKLRLIERIEQDPIKT